VKRDGWIFGVSGVVFGVLVGWIIGTQRGAAPVATPSQTTAAQQAPAARQAPQLDTQRATELEQQANARPNDAAVRTELANLYFDARRFDLAIPWYQAALKLEPKNVNISTDLAVSYYSTNDFDRALKQIDVSLAIDARHVKTLLNQGIIRAFGKNDLAGAAESWQKVVAIAPDSQEAKIAREGLEGIKSRHGEATAGAKGRGGLEPRP
jgi:cytochrome c-type biogenesis protein CcmH/NrfG